MNRLRVLLATIFVFSLYVSNAQETDQMAASAYAQGNYEDAAQLYDMAASLAGDSSVRAGYYDMARKSRECKSLLSRAIAVESSGDYETARTLYARIISLNPSDKTVKSRLSKVDSYLAQKRAAADLDKLYINTLKGIAYSSGAIDVSPLLDFVGKNPKDARSPLLQNISKHLGSLERTLIKDDVEYYLAAGKDFKLAGNNELSEYFFDCAASFADIEGLYCRALTYDTQSKGYKSLLAIAAEAGHEEARKLAADFKYDKSAALEYYRHLCSCHSNMESALFVFANHDNYCLTNLHPEEYIVSYMSADADRLVEVNDSMLYHLATSSCIDDKVLRANMLLVSAIMGNADAMAEYARLYAKKEYKDAFRLFAWVGGVVEAKSDISGPYADFNDSEAKAYMRLLSGARITDDEAFTLYLEAAYGENLDAHEALYVAAIMSDSKYTYSRFKEFWKSAKHIVYDAAFIEGLINELVLRSQDSSFYSKVIKKLSQAKKQDGCYEDSPARYLASVLDLDKIHRTENIVMLPVLVL